MSYKRDDDILSSRAVFAMPKDIILSAKLSSIGVFTGRPAAYFPVDVVKAGMVILFYLGIGHTHQSALTLHKLFPLRIQNYVPRCTAWQ